MGSFLDVTLPPVLLALGVGLVAVFGTVITLGKLHTYAAQRVSARAVQQQVTSAAAKSALVAASSALDVVISDLMPGTESRETALVARAQVQSVLNREK